MFRDRLSVRASNAGVIIPTGAAARLEAYIRLLAVWNEKINLTALPLRPPTDEALDRLLIEPLAAARFAPVAPHAWFDLGSGGGSPAIPFKIAHLSARLTMVESTAKKAAFLREAVRVLELSDTAVMNERFENLADHVKGLDLLTVRAVKTDPAIFRTVHGLMAPQGRVFLFHSSQAEPNAPADMFSNVAVARLGTAGDARLTILTPVFHVEQR